MSVMHRLARRSWRWLFVLAASILIHLLAFTWAGGGLSMPGTGENETPAPVMVSLLPPPVKIEPPPPPPPPPPKPKPKPRAQPKQPQEAAPDMPAQSTPPAPPASDTPAAQDGAAGGTEAGAGTPDAEPMQDAAVAEAEAEEPAADSWHAAPPPPAELEYAVTALRDGSNWHGSGRFQWHTDGERYRISGEAYVTIVFRIAVLNFHSEGRINQTGIAPERYTETPWRKATALTWFDRDAGRISFSSSSASWPYEGGEQDRASIAWQLAALGRGDPHRFAQGGEFDIVVAGARSADRWRFRLLGQEEVETPHGRHLAWRVQRLARSRRDQGIDIWLAPQLDWYPIRIRHHYANGEFLDMSLSELRGPAPSTDR